MRNPQNLAITVTTALFVFVGYRIIQIRSMDRHWARHHAQTIDNAGVVPNKNQYSNAAVEKAPDTVERAQVKEEITRPNPDLTRPAFLEESRLCMQLQFDQIAENDIWEHYSKVVMNCSVMSKMRIEPFNNRDETKYFSMPARYAGNPFIKECTTITLGIGKDIDAETRFITKFPHCEFIGADPVKVPNEELYSSIGKYVHSAVGATDGVIETDVLVGTEYSKANVTQVEFLSFIKTNVQRKIIDNLWMDNEYAEYDLFPYLLKDGTPFKEGYKFCQINTEVHGHLGKEEYKSKFGKFIRAALAEKRLLPIRSMQSVHIRAFFLNIGDDECFTRFVENFVVPDLGFA